MPLLLLLVGCLFQTTEFPAPIEGTTYRIEDDVPAKDSEVRVDIMTNRRECMEAKVVDLDACLPRADRASGELHLSFRLRDPQAPTDIFRAISQDQLKVIQDRNIQNQVELIPHEPIGTGQLFVLVIDGSGSMWENDGARIRKVYAALLAPKVIDAFYPSHNSKTGVVAVRFSDKITGLDGGPPQVVTNREDYEKLIRDQLLTRTGGYTHLYDALRISLTELLDYQPVSDFVKIKGAEPTVILLTDGFNNEAASDTCATNAPKLQAAVDMLREIRTNQASSVRPTVYTVGLGTPYRKGNKPKGLNDAVTPQALCGQFMDYRIDPDLEDQGIDHVSLQWIAEAGGGKSYVREKAKDLATVFASAAATRYRWYEVWYKVPDNFYHRRSFNVEFQLLSYDRALTTVAVHPGTWLDAPTATHATGATWHTPTPFRASLAILMPALGVIVLLNYLGPAMFNARRAVFRRARPRRR
ncbi:MAG: VWA domain-containing protein [Alphaproteobacteria bacterium]|nr:VWA domain-containing protein [Alphaproteobacteria bacterium]MCB9699169.1 VWA domain-containing protein [Alphaproteobacteria bacterium]